ncbi:MAG: hypothetical protein P1P88_05830 [Bacteroidales bacterium]|nr:hypothetical protein [Bacteroidales bacterium]
MKHISLILLALALITFCRAQEIKIVKTKGKAQVQWYPERESLTQARDRALELAKINALENAFGTLVMQGNSIYIENKKTGEKVETNTTFKMIGNTAVKGEIIQILKTDFKESKKKEKIDRKKVEITYIDCNLTIEAKELTDTKIEVETYPLSSSKIIRPVTEFYEGDDLFVYFRAPLNGFLTIFLDDGDQAQCLLPYRKMPAGLEEAMPIIADKEYIFFSDKPDFNYFDDDFFAEDTYELVASSEKDINQLYIIFSKTPLNKPILNKDENNKLLVELEKNKYELPRVIDSDAFKKWLVKIQQIRNDLKITTHMITIEKKK